MIPSISSSANPSANLSNHIHLTPAVSCRHISKDFSDGNTSIRVLNDVNVDFYRNQLSLLVGPSGCGKTTLISIIAGLLSPTEGKVNVFDQEIWQLSKSKLVQFRLHHIGFIFQQYNLIPSLNAVENAAVPLIAAGIKRSLAIEQAADILKRLQLGDHLLKYSNQLSGGQQQRVAIGRALVHSPKLVVCDEPTAALDASSGQRVMELLKELAVSEDRACIVVTHDHRVFDFADEINEMEDGKMKPKTHLK
jgi:putative ABC transport system ATP-binding protein